MNGGYESKGREGELLNELEIIKRRGEEITKAEFCRRMGYANKSALRHFPILRQELDLYVGGFGKAEGKSSPSTVRLLEQKIETLTRTCEKQEKDLARIPELESEVGKLNTELAESDNRERQLRGFVSTLIAHFSSNDLTRAREISAQLELLGKTILDKGDDSIWVKNG